MNIPVMEKWIAALRSGEYKQGRAALKVNNEGNIGYCCLGVLCQIAVEENILPPPFISVGLGRVYGGETNYLPRMVQDWAGVDRDPMFLSVRLSVANDNGTTFPEIADLIQGEVNQKEGEP